MISGQEVKFGLKGFGLKFDRKIQNVKIKDRNPLSAESRTFCADPPKHLKSTG